LLEDHFLFVSGICFVIVLVSVLVRIWAPGFENV
jgi:hypothetical protein